MSEDMFTFDKNTSKKPKKPVKTAENEEKIKNMKKLIDISESGDVIADKDPEKPADAAKESVKNKAPEPKMPWEEQQSVEKPAKEAVSHPADKPAYPEGSVESDLEEILGVAKGKYDVPTLVTYYSERSTAYRHVLIDMDCTLLDKAWERWQRSNGKNAEDFLCLVYKITRKPIPRLMRAVAQRRLCD